MKEQLRKLANDLRTEADRRDVQRREDAQHVVKAAAGLQLLSLRVRRHA